MTTFSKLNVLINGYPAGNYHVFMPQLICAQPMIRLPVGMVLDARGRNTVIFNFTWADMIAGLFATAFNWAFAYVFHLIGHSAWFKKFTGWLGGWVSRALGGNLTQRIGNLLGQRFLNGIGRPLMGKWGQFLTTFIDEVALHHVLVHGFNGLIERAAEAITHKTPLAKYPEKWARGLGEAIGGLFDDGPGDGGTLNPDSNIINGAPLVGE